MRKRAIWTAVLSLVVLATLSSSAQACHWYWSRYCGYYPYAIGYSPAPTACFGCYGGYGCGAGGHKAHKHCCWSFPIIKHLCAKHAAHKAWRHSCACVSPTCAGCWSDCDGCDGYAACDSGCGGCGSGCGGYGGCGADDGSHGGEVMTGSAIPDGVPSDAQIISDRVLGEEGQPESIDEGQSADATPARFRLASASTRRDGSSAFERGLSSYRKGSKDEALGSFDSAAQADPQNALYHYHRALALYDLSRTDAAAYAFAQAVKAEGKERVKDWGKKMERVQGRGRVWIEKARREAGLVR